MAAKTKSVGGKDYSARSFAYVGDPNDPQTWHLLIADADHVRDALARFDQAQIPADAKKRVARLLVSAAKKFGIDASGFSSEYLKASEAAAEEDFSFEELQDALQQALIDKFGFDANGYRRYCLCETFPDYVIAQGPDGELYQIGYTVGADEEDLTLGEPQEVETAYVPVQEAARFLATEAQSDKEGWSWPVQIMQAGWARGEVTAPDGQVAQLPHYFPANVVAQVAEAANGARFRRRHPRNDEGSGAELPDLTAGWTSECRMNGGAAVGTLNLLKSETDMRSKFLAAREANKLDLYGVSIFAYFGFQPGMQDGKKALIATRLGKYVGLDLCAEAGAGGKILPYAASKSIAGEIAQLQSAAVKKRAQPPAPPVSSNANSVREQGSAKGASQGGCMREHILKVLEALRTINAGRAAELQKEFEGLAEEKHGEFFLKVSEAVGNELPAAVAANAINAKAAAEVLASATKNALDQQNLDTLSKAKEALDSAKKLQFTATLDRKLAESKLPVSAASLVREHFAETMATDAAVDTYIAKTRQAFAAFTTVGTIGTGSTVEIGRNSKEKIQLAMDRLLGVKEAEKSGVASFRGIRNAYQVITGDEDVHFAGRGFFRSAQAATDPIATADFPNILLNSMTKRLIQDYAEYQVVPGLERLYTTSILGDYKTQNRVRMGYLGDLPTVNENAAYTELSKPSDEKIAYSVVKKGGLLTISEETIRNDDLGKIAQFPNRLARAARHTLAGYVTNLFTANPNYDPDGVAWFHATHANLGTTALSSAELDARAIALAKQTEGDSGNRLGLTLDWIMIPVDLRSTAMQINRNMTGTNNWYQKFGVNEENIIVNPLLTDTNDWFGGCWPASAPFLEIGFLDGYQTPQLFIANLPTQGTQFTTDELQYKAKIVFGGKPIDYRGVFKEAVA